MKNETIGARLLSAAEFVRQGAYLADIGTDHAYLPLFLLKSGRISRAMLCDVNEGPLKTAEKNAREAGLFDKVNFKLTNGAVGLSGLGITDYTICGMGGELIADIIENSPHLKDGDIRLILQPMTKPSALRRYLAGAGFYIEKESYTEDAGKFYVCILAAYDGAVREITDFEAEIGTYISTRVEFSPAELNYLMTKYRAAKRALEGKIKGKEKHTYELSLVAELERVLKIGEK